MKKYIPILVLTICFVICYLLLINVTINEYQNEETTNFTNKETENKIIVQTKTVQYELSRELRLKIEHEFLQRRERVKYLCANLNNYSTTYTFQKVISKKLILDTRHSLTWCPIYKSASSMWMKNFAVLSGFPNTRNFHQDYENLNLNYRSIVKQKFQYSYSFEDKLQQVRLTTKFMIVRHPFERLLSAYRDKLEHMQGRKYYFKHYGQYITHRYRDKQSNLTSLEPSFTEFLQFIAKEKVFDEHWMPFFDSCQPCSINYDYIFKFESLKDEYNYFIKKNDLLDYLNYSNNDRENTSSQGITNETIAQKYFKDVPAVLLLKIFNIYRFDFFLFSYSPVKYYYMANNTLD